MTSTIIPCLSYRDADAMIEWLCTHLGFAANAVHHNDDGQVVHAEIAYRGGMLMLGTAGVGQLDSLLAASGESRATQAIYVVTDDVEAIHDRVAASGADILIASRTRIMAGGPSPSEIRRVTSGASARIHRGSWTGDTRACAAGRRRPVFRSPRSAAQAGATAARSWSTR